MSVKFVLGAAIVGMVISAGIALDAGSAPGAEAASCYGSVSTWKGKNNTCGSARHWDAIRNADARYGPWVGKKKWSQQSACWANVVSYGMTAR
ncbi:MULTISPECIES: hypothetical protein [unclassified Curtobacterium]|uniref:hypothetical protein n=1 Tax=unclassified Curtobacterium TaxID=257496 RepID=UPI002784F00D|nr:hypothetical protein [Curtobacterium sp. 260]MDP9736916.1 hypothetical protein [Curtobacterium sp. 260]